jgi:MOSC domain-containing protein YiiM
VLFGGPAKCAMTRRIRERTPEHPRLASVQVGKVKPLQTSRRVVSSAFVKAAVREPILLGRLGLAGDEQAAPTHGGPDKAVCAYAGEHYPYWERRLARPMGPGDFGENFTTLGLLEPQLRVGASFAVGEAVVQVSQPRAPCFKLSGRHGLPRLAVWVRQTGRTGCYLRVLQEGFVAPGDPLVALEGGEDITIAELNRLCFHDRRDLTGLDRAIDSPALSEAFSAGLLRLRRRRAAARAGAAVTA